jgi:hypothetical protein
MKNYRDLNISGTILDKNQLASYMEKIASEHNIKNGTSKDTYVIESLKKKYHIILETYNLLSKHIKMGIKIHSAGEWILDNFYIIEENVKSIQKDLSLKKYKQMIGISNGKYEGFARSYCLASEIVAYTDCRIDKDTINFCLKAYQKKKLLEMQEIWDLGIFLRVAIISHISEMCEKVYLAELQKERVDSILKRIVEKQENISKKQDNLANQYHGNYKFKVKRGSSDLKYPFIEYMSYKLKEYGKEAIEYQKILENEVEKMGLTVSEVIQKEHFEIANIKVTIGNAIKSLKEIAHINFGELFSFTNATEEILKLDPSKIYSNMDEESKNYYRDKISKISKKFKISEIYIAEKLIELAKKHESKEKLVDKRKSHIGYYLIDEGIEDLYKALEINKMKPKSNLFKSKLYIGFSVIFPIYFCFCLALCFFIKTGTRNVFQAIIISAICYIPFSEIWIRIQNYILSKCKKPEILPKMNYEKEIPKKSATFVVIPTIVKSKEKVAEMMHKLEVYYLANKLDNIYFALLGDCSEETSSVMKFDKEVVEEGKKLSKELNEKYKTEGFPRFHFLYRKRVWNECENSFIGWERKRGLLTTFNQYICGKIENDFLENTIENNINILPDIKYIITLDSDTNLVLNSASKMIGAMDHILNEPVIEKGRVASGYSIMQPRIGLDLGLAQKTYLPELYSMQGRNRFIFKCHFRYLPRLF